MKQRRLTPSRLLGAAGLSGQVRNTDAIKDRLLNLWLMRPFRNRTARVVLGLANQEDLELLESVPEAFAAYYVLWSRGPIVGGADRAAVEERGGLLLAAIWQVQRDCGRGAGAVDDEPGVADLLKAVPGYSVEEGRVNDEVGEIGRNFLKPVTVQEYMTMLDRDTDDPK